MAVKPDPPSTTASTYNSDCILDIGQVPRLPIEYEPEIIYDELLDIHNALEALSECAGTDDCYCIELCDAGGCKEYICGSYKDAVIAMGPEGYWEWEDTDVSTPTTAPDLSANSNTSKFGGTSGQGYERADDYGLYINPCDGPADTPYLVGTDNLEAAIDSPVYFAAGAGLGENGTIGFAINVRQTKATFVTSNSARVIGTWQVYTGLGGTFPYQSASYDIWYRPATGELWLKVFIKKPFEPNTFWYPKVTIDSNLFFDENGDAKWVTFIIFVLRDSTTQNVAFTVWVDGNEVADTLQHNSAGDTGTVFIIDDDSVTYKSRGFETGGDGAHSASVPFPILAAHQWQIFGKITQGQVDVLQAAWEQNHSYYIDPDCPVDNFPEPENNQGLIYRSAGISEVTGLEEGCWGFACIPEVCCEDVVIPIEGQVLKATETPNLYCAEDIYPSGAANQVLTRNSAAPDDVAWSDAGTAAGGSVIFSPYDPDPVSTGTFWVTGGY